MTTNSIPIEQIDEKLPQTQCGLCGFGGCRPYAEAIAFNQAEINLCPPGGVETLLSLATLLNKDAESFIEGMIAKTKPPSIAFIKESECIGCTKCIQACPVDAIIGSSKKMHTIITSECTGCELCIEPCPVDCIEMQAVEPLSIEHKREKARHSRSRFHARNKRLESLKKTNNQTLPPSSKKTQDRKLAILDAVARVKAKQDGKHQDKCQKIEVASNDT